MTGDATRDRLAEVLAGLQDQLADMAAIRKKQAMLTVDGKAADDTVEVTVNAQGQLVKAVIDKSYLDDHDFEELGDHITEAAQAAAADAGRQLADMVAPINERHSKFPSFSDIVDGLPDPSDLIPPGLDAFGPDTRPRKNASACVPGARYDDGEGEAEFPTVKR